jgi:F0F1-type ATP synthase assembly protein I
MAQSNDDRRGMVNTLLIVMVGQVGCLTLVIIIASLFGGLWLDNTLGTKPLFTLILLLAGIPISVIVMIYVARKTLDRLKSRSGADGKEISS